jgi:hypothetical protein
MNKEKEYIQELFTKPTETFSQHLELLENERIIFSGRFGIGKSTFLNHYFEKAKENYNVIHLYPVNYSVLQNEDIFKYIKYDILLRLLTITPREENGDYNYKGFFDGLGSHIINNSNSLFTTFLLLIPELGEQLNQFSKELGQFWKDFKDAPKSETEIENKEIYQFILDIRAKEDGIYETGEITQIIQNGLKKLKKVEKENILIIDDLDRIDPAHIFRILNVFSAHFDDRNGTVKNKFGFDKVILVCDIDNIRNIYAAIYGGNTDFNGYIDKFYSKEIYRYDNIDNINGLIEDLVELIEIEDNQISFKFESRNFILISKIILRQLVLKNKINLRNLLKFRGNDLKFKKKNYTLYGSIIKINKNEALIAIDFLIRIFGDINSLKVAINSMDSFDILELDNYYIDSHLGDLLILLNYEKVKKNLNKKDFEIEYDGIKYIVEAKRNRYDISGRIVIEKFPEDKAIYPDYFEIFKIVLNEIN